MRLGVWLRQRILGTKKLEKTDFAQPWRRLQGSLAYGRGSQSDSRPVSPAATDRHASSEHSSNRTALPPLVREKSRRPWGAASRATPCGHDDGSARHDE